MLRNFLILGFIVMTATAPVALAQQQPDRNLLMPEINRDWKTLTTPHFHIHHEAANKEAAQELAAVAERVHGKLSAWLSWQPQAPTEVVLLDTVDASNGHASPLPYNSITIYMTPPVDGELMGQTPWLEYVFTHEYMHILHLDMASGLPLKMRDVFGRSMDLFTLFDFPQIFAPTWVTEGIAVYGESDNASGYGRLNSAYYEGLMRMEVERGLRSMTQVSFNSGYRWPYGQVYLYGSYFFRFVETRYGNDAVTKYIKIYGSNLIPFRMDSRSEQVFGKSAQIVWTEFQEYLRQRFVAQLISIRQQNSFITHTVYDSLYTSSALAAAPNGDLYFLHDDASARPQIRRISADGSNVALTDGRWVQDIDWHEQSGLLMSKYAVCDNTNAYADLYQWQPGMSAAKRLTHCGRYTFAAWRPDGQAIAAIKSERGVSKLMLLDKAGQVLNVLADLPMGDTLGHIAWSPNGETIVASVQRKKTGWNLELLDINSRHWQALTAGSELVQRPQFSADGTEIYFLSDHAKVWNLRRLKLGSNTIETISNTASIISEAVVMPDRSFRMVENTPSGKAIIALQLSAEINGGGNAAQSYAARNYDTSATATNSVDAYSNAADFQPYDYENVQDYSPWSTLKPHYWFPLFDTSAEQVPYVGVLTSGADALDFHHWSVVPLYYYNQKSFGGLASYSFYNKVTLSAQRQFFVLGNKNSTTQYRNDERRYQALLHHSFNSLESSIYLGAGVASEEIDTVLTRGTGVEQAYNNKITGVILQYDNSHLYKRSIAPVEGRRVQLLGESYDPLGGSYFSGKTSRIDWNEYFGTGDNHALHFRFLRAEGDPGIRPYFLGGVSEVLSKIGGDTGLGRRDFPLRGYPSGLAGLSGSNFGLFTAEWIMPLAYHYDGWFVPPLGVGRESLTLFVDSGDAWNQGESIEAKTGIGIEWNIEALLGYDLLKIATTLGAAKGLDQGGENQLYVRITLPLL